VNEAVMIERDRTAGNRGSGVAGILALLLALCPYVGTVALVVAAVTGAAITGIPTYFVVCTVASCAAIVLAFIGMRERRGAARWGLALAIIYLATAGSIALALTLL
jgi:hypothetical protein